MCGWLAFATALHALTPGSSRSARCTSRATVPGAGTSFRTCLTAPRDLDADSLDATWSCRSFRRSPGAVRTLSGSRHAPGPFGRTSSLGISKDRPSVVLRREVHSRSPSASKLASDFLRGERAISLPCSVLVVSHHLDGFLLRAGARLLHRAADHGVRGVSSRWTSRRTSRLALGHTHLSRRAFLPFEASLPAQRRRHGLPCSPRGSSPYVAVARWYVHRFPCLFVVSFYGDRSLSEAPDPTCAVGKLPSHPPRGGSTLGPCSMQEIGRAHV